MRLGALVLALALFGAVGTAGPTAATDVTPNRGHNATAPPLTLLDSTRAGRLVELTFRTPALAAPTHVRILLPANYSETRRRYPVLYLLHGALDNYRSWTDKGAATQATEALPLIVVMPDGGQGGFYSDWYNNGAGGPPRWETFHIRQLIRWVDHHYRTVDRRAGRAITGLSMGGFGAMSYAARHPDLFTAAASFSGAVDTNTVPLEAEPLDRGVPGGTWGPRPTQEVRWRAHNPWDLAGNLRGMRLTLRTGNGQPGGPYVNGGGDPIEMACWLMSTSLHERLASLGIPHVWDDYGPGAHVWEYWQRDLRKTLPDLMRAFAHPLKAPRPFTHTAVEPRYKVYGWKVQLQRPALEFSRIANVRKRGFQLTGSGTAKVTTAASYQPGKAYRVIVAGPHQQTTETIRANRRGRLRIRVVLGQANPYQQYTAESQAAGTQTYTATVAIHGDKRDRRER